MTARKKKRSYEEGVAELEALISAMSDGEVSLDDSMNLYEKGIALAAELEGVLAEHKKRIEQIDLETGEIRPFEGEENGL